MDGDGNREPAKPIDLCKVSPYVRQKVKDAWISVPKSAPKVQLFDSPRLVRKTPFGLSVPALKAKCSPHTEALALPKFPVPRMHYVTKAEKEAQKEMEEQMTKEELKWLYRKSYPMAPTGVEKAALHAKTTPRIETMALARLSILNETKKRFFSRLNTSQRKFLLRNIEEHYNAFRASYPPEADKVYVLAGGSLIHASCTGKVPEKEKRARCLCELNKNQRRNFRKRMKLMGLPKKPIVPDKGPDRGPKRKIKDFEPWLTMMSQPRAILGEKANPSVEKLTPSKMKSRPINKT